MNKRSDYEKYSGLLYLEALGFLILIAIIWLDEEVILPRHWLPSWFGMGSWHDAVLESIVTVIVGLFVVTLSYRLIKRINQLEEFTRVCAWCHKIHFNGEWISIEDFLKHSIDSECTHGICEKCSEKFRNQVNLAISSSAPNL